MSSLWGDLAENLLCLPLVRGQGMVSGSEANFQKDLRDQGVDGRSGNFSVQGKMKFLVSS